MHQERSVAASILSVPLEIAEIGCAFSVSPHTPASKRFHKKLHATPPSHSMSSCCRHGKQSVSLNALALSPLHLVLESVLHEIAFSLDNLRRDGGMLVRDALPTHCPHSWKDTEPPRCCKRFHRAVRITSIEYLVAFPMQEMQHFIVAKLMLKSGALIRFRFVWWGQFWSSPQETPLNRRGSSMAVPLLSCPFFFGSYPIPSLDALFLQPSSIRVSFYGQCGSSGSFLVFVCFSVPIPWFLSQRPIPHLLLLVRIRCA